MDNPEYSGLINLDNKIGHLEIDSMSCENRTLPPSKPSPVCQDSKLSIFRSCPPLSVGVKVLSFVLRRMVSGVAVVGAMDVCERVYGILGGTGAPIESSHRLLDPASQEGRLYLLPGRQFPVQLSL